jgi:hypothetical protein
MKGKRYESLNIGLTEEQRKMRTGSSQDAFKAVDPADFRTSVLEKHNKAAWILRSFLPSVEKEVKVHHKFDDTLVGSRR